MMSSKKITKSKRARTRTPAGTRAAARPRTRTKPKGKSKAIRARTDTAKTALRDRILLAAIDLFAEVGYKSFSMRKLAERIGYTPTTIYSYFKDKDAVLIEVITYGFDQFRAFLTERTGDPVQKLKALGHAYLDFGFSNPELYKLMFVHRPQKLYEVGNETEAKRLSILDSVANVVAQSRMLRGAEAPIRSAELMWAMMHGLLTLALSVPHFDRRRARITLDFAFSISEPLLRQALDAPEIPLDTSPGAPKRSTRL